MFTGIIFELVKKQGSIEKQQRDKVAIPSSCPTSTLPASIAGLRGTEREVGEPLAGAAAVAQQADAPGQLGEGATDPASSFGCLPHHLPDRVPLLELQCVRSGKKRPERREESRSGSSKSGGRGGSDSEEVLSEKWPEKIEYCSWATTYRGAVVVLRAPAAVHLDDDFLEGAQLDLGQAREEEGAH
jgi:hypothetical protein